MKKLVLAVAVAASMFANADVLWDTWCGNTLRTPNVHLGLGCKALKVSNAEVSLCYNATPVVTKGAQVCLGFNDAVSVKWVQAALVNRADTAKIQIGLLNFNKNGFLPVFPFFNLDKSLFE